MKYYTLDRKHIGLATCISVINNDMIILNSGHLLPEDIEEPILCELDEGLDKGDMATLYIDLGIIATKEFYNDLVALGVDNIEVKNAIIRSEDGKREYTNYLLLNILGCISCADMNASEFKSLGNGMNIMDSLVMKSNAVKDQLIFLLEEDKDCIVVNETIYKTLSIKYNDLLFTEVTLI